MAMALCSAARTSAWPRKIKNLPTRVKQSRGMLQKFTQAPRAREQRICITATALPLDNREAR